MHRTVNGKYFLSRLAEVNGTKTKSLRYGHVKRLLTKREPSKGKYLTRLQNVYMGVLSDDFAAVDVREELCYHSLTEKAQIQEVHGTGIKPMKESHARRQKRRPIPKRVSGDGSAPPRFRVGFPVIFLFAFPWRVLGCGARSEPHLSMPSTRHGAKVVK